MTEISTILLYALTLLRDPTEQPTVRCITRKNNWDLEWLCHYKLK